jgi:uncharacterized protein (DUF111 family)
MKKNRPGVLLSVIAKPDSAAALEAILFRETGTFGIRRHSASRSKMGREQVIVRTQWGLVRAKRGWHGDVEVVTPEYEDCARMACENDVPLREVYRAVARGAG